MKIKRMIELLEKHNQDAGVYRYFRGESPVNYMVAKEGVVYLGDHNDEDESNPLTVREILTFLKAQLKECQDGNMPVHMDTSKPIPALFAIAYKDDDSQVIIECEEDCDLSAELDARFEAVENGEMTEEELYQGLLDLEISASMVQASLGEEEGKRMRKFCQEHNLS